MIESHGISFLKFLGDKKTIFHSSGAIIQSHHQNMKTPFLNILTKTSFPFFFQETLFNCAVVTSVGI